MATVRRQGEDRGLTGPDIACAGHFGLRPRRMLSNRPHPRLHRHGAIHKFERVKNLLGTWLTRFGGLAYIAPTRRAAARRDGAPAKLLTDSVTSRPISVGCLGLRRLSGAPGRGIAMIPGLFDK